MMTFNVRPLELDDYDTYLVGWWNDWGWEAPARDFLPLDGVGGMMVLDIDGTPICAGFVYLTNSKAAWVDWVISSKTYRKKPQRKEAILLLLSSLVDECKSKESKYIFSNNNNSNLIEHFINIGFVKGCTDSTELIKVI